MDLSIVIASWNTRDFLEKCLEAVYTSINSLAMEVIVVDNASTDGSPEMVARRFPQARSICNEINLGFARASNQGIQTSHGRYVLLLNSDAFLAPGAAQIMVNFLDQHPNVGIAGAYLSFPDGSPQPCFGPLPTLSSELASLLGLDKLLSARRPERKESVLTGAVSGACLMARRAMLDEIGLLDDSFFMFSEEVDLCTRAKKAGWQVVHLPGARALHVGGGSTGQTPERTMMLYQGKLHYFSLHLGQEETKRLIRAMRATSTLKVWAYTLLRPLPLIPYRAQHWKDVCRKLKGITA